MALDNEANYLITGDKDLLVLNPYENTVIITLTDFEGLLS
jgi:predicted nucleic acid-binding protein